jgi:glycine/D-amino acid oxidase-like deaminating enzyme
VRAEVVVRATEGYTPELPGMKRDLVPMYSLMVATEPLPNSVLADIGLDQRQTFSDKRHLRIYGQRTADGRLAFGGRGAPYHFGSRVHPAYDYDARVHHMLHDILRDLFPVIQDAAFTHSWGGNLGIPRDWYPSVGFDRHTGVAWAGGYVGDGVTTSCLAGRTLGDLIVGEASDLVALPWVGRRSRRWEPEPLRWTGVNAVTHLMAPIGVRREVLENPRLLIVSVCGAIGLDEVEIVAARERNASLHPLKWWAVSRPWCRG